MVAKNSSLERLAASASVRAVRSRARSGSGPNASRARPFGRDYSVQSPGKRLDHDRLTAGEQARQGQRLLVDVAQIRSRESFVKAICVEHVHVLTTPAYLQGLQ